MIFTYNNAGWEESVDDVRVLGHSVLNPQFHFPHPFEGYHKLSSYVFVFIIFISSHFFLNNMPSLGKYYLVDSGYPNTIGYLASYTKIGVRCLVLDLKKYGPPSGVRRLIILSTLLHGSQLGERLEA